MDDQDRRADMPAHELDQDEAVGGGLTGSGGTAVDRGTGEVTDRTDPDETDALDDGMIGGPPAGGAQPYVPAVTDDDEDAAVPDV
jgi:hypothetical protein